MLTINNVEKFKNQFNTSFQCTHVGAMGPSLYYYFWMIPIGKMNMKYVINIYRGSENDWSAVHYLPKTIDGKLHYQMDVKWEERGKSSKVIKRSSEILFVDVDTIKDKKKLLSFFTQTIKSLI